MITLSDREEIIKIIELFFETGKTKDLSVLKDIQLNDSLFSSFSDVPPHDLKDYKTSIALEELGPSFIKFGQMLSTRPDLIGEVIANDLSTLQDNLPSFSSQEARKTIETELKAKINELFDDLKINP